MNRNRIRSWRYTISAAIITCFIAATYGHYYQQKLPIAILMAIISILGITSGILDAIRGYKLTEEANKPSTKL